MNLDNLNCTARELSRDVVQIILDTAAVTQRIVNTVQLRVHTHYIGPCRTCSHAD